MINDIDQDKALELMTLCTPIDVFAFEGVAFLGYYPQAVREYLELNPSEKFYTWLCNNYQRVDI